MMEVLVALGILGFIGVAFMTALATAFRGTDITDEQVTAENLARAQLEYLREQPFELDLDYTNNGYVPPPGVTLPAGYTMTVVASQFCDGAECRPTDEIQRITARVSRDGTVIKWLEDLKTIR